MTLPYWEFLLPHLSRSLGPYNFMSLFFNKDKGKNHRPTFHNSVDNDFDIGQV